MCPSGVRIGRSGGYFAGLPSSQAGVSYRVCPLSAWPHSQGAMPFPRRLLVAEVSADSRCLRGRACLITSRHAEMRPRRGFRALASRRGRAAGDATASDSWASTSRGCIHVFVRAFSHPDTALPPAPCGKGQAGPCPHPAPGLPGGMTRKPMCGARGGGMGGKIHSAMTDGKNKQLLRSSPSACQYWAMGLYREVTTSDN